MYLEMNKTVMQHLNLYVVAIVNENISFIVFLQEWIFDLENLLCQLNVLEEAVLIINASVVSLSNKIELCSETVKYLEAAWIV
jgi:hypothetical protein